MVARRDAWRHRCGAARRDVARTDRRRQPGAAGRVADHRLEWAAGGRSEEHTSELQSLMRISYAVFYLKKKNNITNTKHHEFISAKNDHNKIKNSPTLNTFHTKY